MIVEGGNHLLERTRGGCFGATLPKVYSGDRCKSEHFLPVLTCATCGGIKTNINHFLLSVLASFSLLLLLSHLSVSPDRRVPPVNVDFSPFKTTRMFSSQTTILATPQLGQTKIYRGAGHQKYFEILLFSDR